MVVFVSFDAHQVAPVYPNRTTEYFPDDRYKVRYSLSVPLHQNLISIYYLELEEDFTNDFSDAYNKWFRLKVTVGYYRVISRSEVWGGIFHYSNIPRCMLLLNYSVAWLPNENLLDYIVAVYSQEHDLGLN